MYGTWCGVFTSRFAAGPIFDGGTTWPEDYPPWKIPPAPNDPRLMGKCFGFWVPLKPGLGFPIVVDLHGNGIKTISLDHGPFFDYNGDGLAERSGWVSPDAGILVMDRNSNGVVDNGSELFGSLTPLPNGEPAADGFQALADLDSSHDGKIDAQDTAYSQLSVWVDSDTDGVTQPGELFTLPQLGIDSIDLNWTTVNTTDAQGNFEMYAGSFQWTDGTTGLIADYGFQVEPYNSRNLPGELSMMYLEPQAAYASGMRKHTTSSLTLPPRVMERSVRESSSYSGRA
ncbi:MAG: hypothetical protein V1792_01490 [Pseudomonadota bacterium]